MSNVRCSLFVCHDFCDASQYRLAEIFRWPIWEKCWDSILLGCLRLVAHPVGEISAFHKNFIISAYTSASDALIAHSIPVLVQGCAKAPS
jgi:hypothetical protein